MDNVSINRFNKNKLINNLGGLGKSENNRLRKSNLVIKRNGLFWRGKLMDGDAGRSWRFLFFGLFVFILTTGFMQSVFALGITPGRTTLDYAPGKIETYQFEVVNSDQQEIEIVVLVQGELNASVSVSEVSFKMLNGEASKKLSYTLTMPSGLKPGLHTAEIVALQLPGKSGSSGTYVGATVGVATQIHVYVPYPGKYLEASFDVMPSGDGDIRFIVPVISRGELGIVRAKAVIDIYTSLNEKIDSVVTDEIEIKSLDRRELTTLWKPEGAPPGRYKAVATIIYDEETTTVEKEFSIGEQNLEIKNIEVNDFSLGGIAKFEILVENKWSEIIPGAFVQMQIFNKEGQVMADFKSAAYDIPPLEKKLVTAFWDTDGVGEGTYDSSIFLKFAQQSLKQDLKLEVSEDDITVVGLGYVIKNKSGKSGESNSLLVVLIAAIGILVLLNVVWFLMLRKKVLKK